MGVPRERECVAARTRCFENTPWTTRRQQREQTKSPPLVMPFIQQGCTNSLGTKFSNAWAHREGTFLIQTSIPSFIIMCPRLSLSFWLSCLHIPSTGTTSMSHNIRSEWFCVWNQDFEHARQALHHLGHIPSTRIYIINPVLHNLINTKLNGYC